MDFGGFNDGTNVGVDSFKAHMSYNDFRMHNYLAY